MSEDACFKFLRRVEHVTKHFGRHPVALGEDFNRADARAGLELIHQHITPLAQIIIGGDGQPFMGPRHGQG